MSTATEKRPPFWALLDAGLIPESQLRARFPARASGHIVTRCAGTPAAHLSHQAQRLPPAFVHRAYARTEISPCPQMLAPVALLQLRIFILKHTARLPFHVLHQLRRGQFQVPYHSANLVSAPRIPEARPTHYGRAARVPGSNRPAANSMCMQPG